MQMLEGIAQVPIAGPAEFRDQFFVCQPLVSVQTQDEPLRGRAESGRDSSIVNWTCRVEDRDPPSRSNDEQVIDTASKSPPMDFSLMEGV